MPVPDFTSQFNTPLNPKEQAQFESWAARKSQETGHSAMHDMFDYDIQGAWKSGAARAANGHLPDTFKKPNHPTFSDESMYQGIKLPDGQTAIGGSWGKNGTGDWVFMASPTNTAIHGPAGLQNYFKRIEPDSRLILPSVGMNPVEALQSKTMQLMAPPPVK